MAKVIRMILKNGLEKKEEILNPGNDFLIFIYMAKTRKILVDADALVALAKPGDLNHKKALITAKRLKNDILFITQLTIPEASTVISYRVSQKAAKIFLIAARERNLMGLVLNPGAIKSANEVFLAQKRKGTSWINCLNVTLIKINSFAGIFSDELNYFDALLGKITPLKIFRFLS